MNSEQVCVSTAPPVGTQKQGCPLCSAADVCFRPSWFESWICLRIQTRPHCKSFHLSLNVHFCTFLIEEPQLQEVGERNFAVCDVFGEGWEEPVEEKRKVF